MRALLICVLLPALSARAQAPAPSVAGARDLAYAADGRLALSVRGDLWTVSASGSWTRITSGPEWDREPTWSADGKSLLFSSNRSGNFDIWEVDVSDSGAVRAPRRLFGSADDDGNPVSAPNGRTLFVRGHGSAARLWVRDGDATERRLTSGRVAERWPALSPDGQRVA
jgi:Tol biopolymer transport system component